MDTSIFKLEKILDLKKWQTLQDSLAEVTKLAIITVDYKGVPITLHSKCRPFCENVRRDPELAKRCQKCDSRGGLEAVRLNAPYIYLCHYNLVDIAIPISIAGQYVGAVMAGQVRLTSIEDLAALEQIASSRTVHSILNESAQLRELYDGIPALSLKDIIRSANMLYHLCNYIVEEAKNKNYILETYENLASINRHQPADAAADDINIRPIDQIKDALANAVTSTYLDPAPNLDDVIKNKLLRPAFEYLFLNKNKMLSLNEAAALCHISSSYFSRLFTKETGRVFTAYTALLKLEWAKQLLEKTDLSITQISDELGFSDPGYFIKIFKKYEQITPLIYRKYIRKGI